MGKSAMKSAAMKAGKGKAMKNAMKAKRVSKIAKGKNSRRVVMQGYKEKTATGLTAAMLMRNKRNKIVSKKAHAASVKQFNRSSLRFWNEAVREARKAVNATGFVAINGKTAQGKALYAKAKALFAAKKQA